MERISIRTFNYSPRSADASPHKVRGLSVRLITALALAALSLPAVAVQEPVKAKLQAIYDQTDALILKKDLKGLMKYIGQTRTPDYVLEAKSGKTGLQKWAQSMYSVLTGFDKITKATVHIDRLTISDNSAVVSVSTSLGFSGRSVDDRKTHTVEEEFVGDDTWVKVRGEWKLKRSKAVKESFFKDGKAVKG